MIIGESVITNDDQRTRLFIKGDAPILREKDIFTAETADSPAKKIYLIIQMMYLEKNTQNHHEMYFKLINELIAAAPSCLPYIERINNRILTDSLYKALKEAKALIAYEGELIDHASGRTSV
ncbi:MAG: flagellar biosynthesis repressor FlbT [Fimbriimonadaceae bacterium]|nr:flagellar biosynthesis repressor FlbT [Alphaproteobacteria bacterium]